MNEELQRYYSDRLEMFTSDGWRDLIEDVEQMWEAVDHVGGITTEAELQYKKGELSILNWLLALQSISEETYEDLQA